MKFVIAIIQPDRLDDVLDELESENIHLVTVNQVVGRGRQKGISQIYRSHIECRNLLKKIKIEIVINDSFLDKTLNAIQKGAKTGHIGDGKIFVFPIEKCIRIRTGEEDHVAIGD